MLDIIFELFLANGTEKVICARFRLFYDFGVFLLICLFAIEILQVFHMLILEKIIVFRSIVSLICKGE